MSEKVKTAPSIGAAASPPQAQTGTGWIRRMRGLQQMQAKQLAQIMGVSPARVSVLERDELRGAVTLKMMQKAAEALDCSFVYALVPKAAPAQGKPRIRIDPASMKRDGAAPESAYQQYQRGRPQTKQD